MNDNRWAWICIVAVIILCIISGYNAWVDWSYKMAIIKSLGAP